MCRHLAACCVGQSHFLYEAVPMVSFVSHVRALLVTSYLRDLSGQVIASHWRRMLEVGDRHIGCLRVPHGVRHWHKVDRCHILIDALDCLRSL